MFDDHKKDQTHDNTDMNVPDMNSAGALQISRQSGASEEPGGI